MMPQDNLSSEKQQEIDPALHISGLTVSYGGASVLFSIDFDVPVGVMSVIAGPNGAGKSTLIKAALNIVPRISGEIKLFGLPLSANRHRVAYVPQRASIDWDFPACVSDVVSMGLYQELGLLRRYTADHRQRVREALERVGLQDFSQRQIGQLSGGQQQRVFVARALVQNADLYILDEPFAAVDAATERTLVAVLQRLVLNGKTVLCVHHDLSTAADYFSHAMLLNIRRIAAGPMQNVFTPQALQETYGARLSNEQLERIRLNLAAREDRS
jgi:manganese/zinc/iron transport system ATP- binding protein